MMIISCPPNAARSTRTARRYAQIVLNEHSFSQKETKKKTASDVITSKRFVVHQRVIFRYSHSGMPEIWSDDVHGWAVAFVGRLRIHKPSLLAI